MASTANPMVAVRKRLSGLGIKPKYLRQTVLPDWWDDKIALDPAGYSEGLIYISRHLGLDRKFLEGKSASPKRSLDDTKFKMSNGVEKSDVATAQAIAVSAATVARIGVPQAERVLPSSALEIREQILERSGIVQLESLVDYCWDVGIPVIHVSNFPKAGKKMDGLCAIVDGSPVIVLSKNSKFPAWLVFVLAHELGHIVLGHLDSATVLVDQNIESFDVDGEEQQANSFASTILTGRQNLKIRGPRIAKGEHLAHAATKFGNEHNIDPGVVVLNYGWTMKNFAGANRALGIIENNKDPKHLINRKMFDHLVSEEIPGESFEWLLRVTGADHHA